MVESGALPTIGPGAQRGARLPAGRPPPVARLIRDLTDRVRRRAPRGEIVDAVLAGAGALAQTSRVFLLELVPTDILAANESASGEVAEGLAIGSVTLTLFGPDPPAPGLTDDDWRALLQLLKPGEASELPSFVTPEGYALEPARLPADAAPEGRRLVVLPIAGDAARASSLLALFDTPVRALTEGGRLGLATWVGVTALALEQLALREAERRIRLEGEELRQVALTLTGTLDLDVVLARVLAAVRALIGADWASIALVGEHTGFVARHFSTLQTGAARWYESTSQLRPGGTSRRVLESREPHFVDDLAAETEANQSIRQLGVRAVATLPMVARGESVGLLYANFAEPHTFTPREGELLGALAAQAAVAIRNAELYSSLRRSEGELRAVLESQASGICLTDLAGAIRYANRAFGDLVGMAPEALVGWPLRSLAGEAIGARTTDPAAFAARLDAGRDAAFSAEMELVEPRSRLLSHTVYPARDETGAAIGRVDIYRDITELRRLQRVRDDFLATAAHELRTPLTVIRSHAHVLKHLLTAQARAIGDDEPLRSATAIGEQTAAMSAMVSQFLDVVRLGRDAPAQDFARVELRELVTRAVEQARTTTDRHRFRLLLPPVRLHDTLPVQGNALQLARVLTNLLDNAIKYSPDGGTITVEGYSTPEQVVVSVSDEGLGLTDEQRRNLFARYYQAQGSQGQTYRGLGLGLYLCKEIVDRHNGRIEVESAGLGCGSTFTLLLPASRPTPKPGETAR